MEYATLRFEVSERVAHITLNRPDRLNTLNIDMARDLMHAAIRCDEDSQVGAVLLSGAGKAFCGGGDLRSFIDEADHLAAHVKEVTTYLHAAVSRLARMEAPWVVVVHGSAAGAGMSLALAADLVVAAASARFTMAYTRIGLCPDGSSSYFLSRTVGLRRALELALTNRTLSAQEAADWGIVNRVVPDSEVFNEARSLATELATGPTRGLAAAKRLLRDGWTETLETQMEAESRAIADVARTADAQEGIRAFLDKRPPCFQGR